MLPQLRSKRLILPRRIASQMRFLLISWGIFIRTNRFVFQRNRIAHLDDRFCSPVNSLAGTYNSQPQISCTTGIRPLRTYVNTVRITFIKINLKKYIHINPIVQNSRVSQHIPKECEEHDHPPVHTWSILRFCRIGLYGSKITKIYSVPDTFRTFDCEKCTGFES